MLAEKRGEFIELFREFVDSYPLTSKGQSHLEHYEEEEKEGKKNFEAILQAEVRGEDVTEKVLMKLLPYEDTKANREMDYWISIASVFKVDVKKKLEASGWTKPEDWPEVSNAILRFVRRCNDHPEELKIACDEFSDSPYSKGFQAGTLTPILHALRPDDFILINNKSRQVVNYFSGTSYSSRLADYPSINEMARSMVNEISDDMRKFEISGIRYDDLFDMFTHWLVAIKKFNFDDIRYWKIAPGESAWNWDACHEGGFIAIGWSRFGDVSHLSKAEFEKKQEELILENEDWHKMGSSQVWTFAHIIKKGDRIVANRGKSEVLGIGTVVGPYYFIPDQKHGHRLPVRWDDLTPRQVNEQAWLKTIIELDREKFENIIMWPPYPLTQCAEDTGFDLATLERWIRAIKRKKQAILYGPPGTGKTYVAEHLAKHLIGEGNGFPDIVQFHPAYAYEDFIQGIRPQSDEDGGLRYPLVPGRFLEFCERAESCSGTCVLIIDEINRANLSQVFGELMYLLEYRDRSIPLAGGRKLKIPENVLIIGTMNTADRSIALVDHALRRRFAFLRLQPNHDVLRNYHQNRNTGFPVEGLIGVLGRLNNLISDPHYEVGISFFLRENLAEEIEDIWKMEIEPYLDEHFFDQDKKVDDFRWEKVGREIMP